MILSLSAAFTVFFMLSGESQAVFFDPNLRESLLIRYKNIESVPGQSSVKTYSYGVGVTARNGQHPIDLAIENEPLHQYIQQLKTMGRSPKTFIVPGFVPPTDEPIQLHGFAKMRLNSVVRFMNEYPNSVVFLTGGNVKPEGTSFNEALEMKKRLVDFHRVPEFLVGIDPNAQNTVTNLRNAGRFLLAFNIEEATIVTTLVQNLYVSFPGLSGFDRRSRRLLGYSVGKVENLDLRRALFWPSPKVMEKSPSLIDP